MKNKIAAFVVVCGLLSYADIAFGMQPVPKAIMDITAFQKDEYHRHIQYILSQPSNRPDPNNCLHVSENSLLSSSSIVNGLIIKNNSSAPVGHAVLVYADPDLKVSTFKCAYIEHKNKMEGLTPVDLPPVVYDKFNTPLFRLNIIKGKLPYKKIGKKIFVSSAFDQLLTALGACYHEYPFVIIGGTLITGVSTVAIMCLIISNIALRFPTQ